jgi:hypothetical protein
MFAYFTLISYLVVGGICVRTFMPEMKSVEFTSEYYSLLSPSQMNTVEVAPVAIPEMQFENIKFPVEKKVVVKAVVATKKTEVKLVQKPAILKFHAVAVNELPFAEPVVLPTINWKNELESNLASIYIEFQPQMIAEVKEVNDEVSTTLAAAVNPDAEPEFFEYETKVEDPKKEEAPASVVAEKTNEEITEDPSTSPQVVNNVDNNEIVNNPTEEVSVDELVAFDYSKANQDVKEQTLPTVSKMTTQVLPAYMRPQLPAPAKSAPANVPSQSSAPRPTKPVTSQNEDVITAPVDSKSNGFVPTTSYSNRMTIQLTGTDLKTSQPEVGFEIRYQDDLSEAVQDYNSGEITVENELANAKMNRTVTLLKHGFAPTNTDLILEDNGGELSIPAIDEATFNELLAPYESRGPIGAVLVELDVDNKVEGATLDVPYSQVLKLDDELKVTEGDSFSYQIFIGVRAGNALLGYKGNNGEVTSKIIHIHERELTFESNFFEEVTNEKVVLLEEDLLGKEKTPLIISSEEVRQFATDKTAIKINNHTYRTSFNRTLLGARKYLELGHQSEPVFVGYKEATKLDIPSENFMRYILSKFEGSKLGNRCLVQVNLTKKALKVDLAAESVGSSLMTYTQILDADGKFYDSIDSKSRKIIVVGENQSSDDQVQDGKINFKITYQDGTFQYFGSYCSPNTYLVEQL